MFFTGAAAAGNAAAPKSMATDPAAIINRLRI